MSEPAGDEHDKVRIYRPFSVTLLAVLVLMLAVMNLLRLLRAAALWDFLSEVLTISPLYFVLTGLIWTITGGVLLWGLWRGRNWAPRITLLAFLAYSFYFWFDRLFLATGAQMANWPFLAAVNLLLLFWILWIFRRRGTREYFSNSFQEHFSDQRQVKP